jgi:diguanylate cyclase (GGDEF)-like protein
MLAARLSEARRQGFPVTVAVVDVADLGAINREHGALAGDQVLAVLGSLLAGRFRREDVRGRLGDDSFLLGFSGADPDSMQRVLERIQDEFAAFRHEGLPELEARVDIGVAGYPRDGSSVSELIGRAWQRLNES